MILGILYQDIQNGWYSFDLVCNGEIIGFVYYDVDGYCQVVYIDLEEQVLVDQLVVIFLGKLIMIFFCLMGGGEMVIFIESELDLGIYYFFVNGCFQLIGQCCFYIEEEQFVEVCYIEYEVCDGCIILGYLIVLYGEGLFLLVIMLYGGFWVLYCMLVFEEWGQFLVSQGYMVFELLFCGIIGLGVDYWMFVFGEWGCVMFDDMDDGVFYLVEQGMVDCDCFVMWGWSFGGYLLFVVVMCILQIYQCVIVGVGVGDLVEFWVFFICNCVGCDLFECGYEGLNIVVSVSDMNVLILVVYGDFDQCVCLYYSEVVVVELECYGKLYCFVILEGVDYFDNMLIFDYCVQLYMEMINFFCDECGLGGFQVFGF